jgi:hypothetical protein
MQTSDVKGMKVFIINPLGFQRPCLLKEILYSFINSVNQKYPDLFYNLCSLLSYAVGSFPSDNAAVIQK